MEKVKIVPLIVGALGTITTELETGIEKLGNGMKIAKLQKTQKTPLLGTARIPRKVLEIKT